MEIRLYMIDASVFSSPHGAHEAMQKVFLGYEYAGHNLDALYDVLTSIRRDAEIRIWGIAAARGRIGAYADEIVTVFRAAAAHNPHLRLVVGA